MKGAVFLLVALAAGFALWVRLAQSDPARWHVGPPQEAKRWPGGLIAVIDGDRARFRHLAGIIEKTPRTKRLAGDVEEGRVTFITRSALWGFPDYTTIAHADGRIRILARLRFGRSDLGVNSRRVSQWLEALDAVEK
ncbi:MAG TPA: DUF1499 domain-containing protein [Aliiroseovarius sp.]|nr:DUF1499 domain-containing protein [Aliiroseovarius sp.]